jgi:hypothetical protein
MFSSKETSTRCVDRCLVVDDRPVEHLGAVTEDNLLIVILFGHVVTEDTSMSR